MKRLIECVYWLVMGAIFMGMAYSCAYAQEIKAFGRTRRNIPSDVRAASTQRPPAPDNVNQKFIYMRGDTVFQIEFDGVEVPLLPVQTFKILPEYKGWFVSVSKDSSGEIVSAKVKVPKLEIVQADSIIWISTAVDSIQKFGWITDSITWVATDTTTFKGDSKCAHEWIYGKPDFSTVSWRFGCLVNHDGAHCDYDDDVREKICRKCLRSVIEREKWFQRFVAPPKSEFEILKEKQRVKR